MNFQFLLYTKIILTNTLNKLLPVHLHHRKLCSCHKQRRNKVTGLCYIQKHLTQLKHASLCSFTHDYLQHVFLWNVLPCRTGFMTVGSKTVKTQRWTELPMNTEHWTHVFSSQGCVANLPRSFDMALPMPHKGRDRANDIFDRELHRGSALTDCA